MATEIGVGCKGSAAGCNSGCNGDRALVVEAGEVVPEEAVEGVGWSGPVECAVGTVLIVEVDEPVVGGGALPVATPVTDVCPFLEQDAVEPFDLAVGLRPVGTGPFRCHSGLGERLEPQP